MRILLVALHFAFVGAKCPFPGIPANATAQWDSNSLTWDNRRHFEADEMVTFRCGPGRQFPTDHSAAIVCREDGTWNASVPRCDRTSWTEWRVEIYDTAPNIPPRWRTVTANEFQRYPTEMFRLQVAAGPISDVEITTMSSRREIRMEGNVTRVRDEHPQVDSVTVNDSICRLVQSANFTHRFRCFYEGNEGHNLVVNISLSFRANLESVTLLLQDVRDCGLPSVPLNGHVINVEQLTVEYNCTEGFYLSGLRNAICNLNTGRWIGVPTCSQPVPGQLRTALIAAVAIFATLMLVSAVSILVIWQKEILCFRKLETDHVQVTEHHASSTQRPLPPVPTELPN